MLDRRQRKTRYAIFNALQTLLEQKQYSAITVQEIIDEANIGRSTFYAHFQTKDDLLHCLCRDMFHHVFTDLLPQEEDTMDCKNLELKLGHLLYHLKENRVNIRGILSADGDGQFMAYFKQYLSGLFGRYRDLFPQEVPEDYLIHHLAGSFAETVKWWVAQEMVPDPETLAHFFMLLVYNTCNPNISMSEN